MFKGLSPLSAEPGGNHSPRPCSCVAPGDPLRGLGFSDPERSLGFPVNHVCGVLSWEVSRGQSLASSDPAAHEDRRLIRGGSAAFLSPPFLADV